VALSTTYKRSKPLKKWRTLAAAELGKKSLGGSPKLVIIMIIKPVLFANKGAAIF